MKQSKGSLQSVMKKRVQAITGLSGVEEDGAC